MGTFEVGLNAFRIMILLRAYGAREWNVVIGSHKLTGNGAIRRCGLVGDTVSLWRQALRSHVYSRHTQYSVYFLLPVGQDVGLSAPSLTPCLPAGHQVSPP